MRALSIVQPWGAAVLHFGKQLENRSWRPPRLTVGERIALHTSSKPPGRYELERVANLAGVAFDVSFTAFSDRGAVELVPTLDGHPLHAGAIIGTVLVRGCFESRAAAVLELGEQAARWWIGPKAWWLSEPRPLRRPVSCRGALGLWTLPADVERVVLSNQEAA